MRSASRRYGDHVDIGRPDQIRLLQICESLPGIAIRADFVLRISCGSGYATGPLAEVQRQTMSSDPRDSEVLCQSCSALMVVDSSQRAVRCPFCDAAGVMKRPPSSGRPEPVFVLAFTLDREEATHAVSRWIARQKMAPFGLKGRAAERIAGVYLPTYLYSTAARSDYQASIGEQYGEVRVGRKPGGGASLGRQEQLEYRELRGRHVAYLVDVVVTASRGITNPEVQAIEPFELDQLRRYSPALIAGWSAEEPSLPPEECLRLARTEGQAAIRRALHEFMPGDGVRDLRHTTVFEEESIDLTLAPVWVFAFRYHPRKPPLRVLVNGQTGKVSGALPFAWGKLGLIAVGVVLAAGALVAALSIFARSGL